MTKAPTKKAGTYHIARRLFSCGRPARTRGSCQSLTWPHGFWLVGLVRRFDSDFRSRVRLRHLVPDVQKPDSSYGDDTQVWTGSVSLLGGANSHRCEEIHIFRTKILSNSMAFKAPYSKDLQKQYGFQGALEQRSSTTVWLSGGPTTKILNNSMAFGRTYSKDPQQQYGFREALQQRSSTTVWLSQA